VAGNGIQLNRWGCYLGILAVGVLLVILTWWFNSFSPKWRLRRGSVVTYRWIDRLRTLPQNCNVTSVQLTFEGRSHASWARKESDFGSSRGEWSVRGPFWTQSPGRLHHTQLLRARRYRIISSVHLAFHLQDSGLAGGPGVHPEIWSGDCTRSL